MMLILLHFRSLAVTVLIVFMLTGVIDNNRVHGQVFGDPFGNAAKDEEKVTLSAEFKLKPDSRVGLLYLSATIAPSHHIYSITQPKKGPIPSRIKVANSDQYTLLDEFAADAPPHVDDSREIFAVNVEYHEDKVTWSAPIQIAEGIEHERLSIELTYSGQVCEVNQDGVTIGCLNLDDLKAKGTFKGFDPNIVVPDELADSAEPHSPKDAHVQFTARIVNQKQDKSAVMPGDKIKLEFTAAPTDGHHIYQYAEKVVEDENATLFSFNATGGWRVSSATPSTKPYQNKVLGYSGHNTPITWTFEIEIPKKAAEGIHEIDGAVAFQTCTDSTCDPPTGLLFRLQIPVSVSPFLPKVFFLEAISEKKIKQWITDGWEKSTDDSADQQFTDIGPVTPELIQLMSSFYDPESKINYIHYSEMDEYPIGTYKAHSGRQPERQTTLFMAAVGMFLGGILLNLMPCVFPVLGLKVMGFVEQSGSDPSKIRMHGIVFSLGLLVSMWVLAGFILTLKFALGQNVSWGAEQMGNPYFVLGIIILLFLLGLNMAGVFELGTSLTRVGGSVDNKKGYTSSFLTGVLTTIIATPCSGPFLGTAMGYTFSQTVEIAMLLFTIFALGIAFPYIVLCFFPSLISALPRPGAWMHTFKVIMAFALFATVAFFMQTFGNQTGVQGLSWLIMALVVIGLAAFFYGTWSPAYVKPYKRLLFGWILPTLVMGTGIWMGCDAARFQNTAMKNQVVDGLFWNNWYPGFIEYSLSKKPKVIWADYTATWCPTCITNKKVVFSSTNVKKKIEELGVELVKVDYTSKDPSIAIDLNRSDQVNIPVNIIYPPNYPEEPAILLNGIVTHWDALKIFERMEAIQRRMADSD